MIIKREYRAGAKGALLDEYERAIAELKELISGLDNSDLIITIDPFTADENCRSVQTILSHVVCSGFNYAVAIRKLKDEIIDYREPVFHETINMYHDDLQHMFNYTVDSLQHFTDQQFEEHDNTKKITSRWGQIYDIEQMMEHAIVHILRHRRQIERFILKLRNIDQLGIASA